MVPLFLQVLMPLLHLQQQQQWLVITTAAGGAIDVALLNNTAMQAIEDMGELIAVLQPYIWQPDGSIHPDIVTYFNLVLDGLYNIKGNLTGVTPLPRE